MRAKWMARQDHIENQISKIRQNVPKTLVATKLLHFIEQYPLYFLDNSAKVSDSGFLKMPFWKIVCKIGGGINAVSH